jgi:hypothetical protein
MTRQTLKCFVNNFGPNIWKNLCVVVTNWSSSPERERVRQRQRPVLDVELRTRGYLAFIHEDFPASQREDIRFYFTDVFEIGEDYDRTSAVLADLITHAQGIPYFDC